MLEERTLDPAVHDREGFDCGVPALNEYLQRYAEQHRRKGISAAYVLVVDAKDENAGRFYERFGFRRLMDRDPTRYLPLGR